MTNYRTTFLVLLLMAVFGLASTPVFVLLGAEPPREVLFFALAYPNALVVVLCLVLLHGPAGGNR